MGAKEGRPSEGVGEDGSYETGEHEGSFPPLVPSVSALIPFW